MATGWNIYVWNSDTLSWDLDGTLDRPNHDFSEGETVSTQQRVILENGSDAYMTPDTKYIRQPLQMSWDYKSQTLRDQILGYIEADSYLKIETHVAGIEYIGQFTDVQPLWLVGQYPNKWGLSAIFEVME